jgi:hypothetical protein
MVLGWTQHVQFTIKMVEAFMNLFAQLLQEVADQANHSLCTCMLKAKLLASRLKGRKFRQWVDAELGGYPSRESAPPYRTIRPRFVGHFYGYGGAQVRNVILTTEGLPPELRHSIENHTFTEHIGGLEALLESGVDTFNHRWDISVVEVLRRVGGVRVDGMVLQEAETVCTRAMVRGVHHSIRFKLLNFLIELGEQYPELERSDGVAEHLPVDAADKVVERAIYQNFVFDGGQAVAKQEWNTSGDLNAGRDIVFANSIRDSFIAAESSAAPSDVKAMLGQLAEAISKAAEAMPADKAKEVAQDFATLAAEATKAEPRKPILKSVTDGLIGTLKVAGRVAEPALSIASALLKHFGAS